MLKIQEFSVSEFSKIIKNLVEDAFGYVKIKGEISGLKKANSGHIYFSLKDDEALLNAVCFKDFALNLDVAIADGLQVSVFGRITVYAGRSNYQIIVEKIEIAGVGAIMEMLEKRKIMLTKEGFFDEKHKKQLPFFPTKIGVITSKEGAVIKDILHRIENRCPTEILFYSVTTQGKMAAKEVIGAIKFFNKQKQENRPELLIIARGGGSIEDLLPFSGEELIKVAFKSDIPIISAIGHETDFCLLDYVADVRAPTPTAAAEIATIVLSEIREDIDYFSNKLTRFPQNFLENKMQKIDNLVRLFIEPHQYLQKITKIIEEYDKKIKFLVCNKIDNLEYFLLNKTIVKERILDKISFNLYRIDNISQKLSLQVKNILQYHENQLKRLNQLFDAKDYKNILKRGFCLLKGKNNQLIFSLDDIKIKSEISVDMFCGSFKAFVLSKNENETSDKNNDKIAKNSTNNNIQLDLFTRN